MFLIIMSFLMYMITLILMMINFLLSKKNKIERNKLSPFECGFDPFNSSRLPFSIQFYMIGIIFLIFDVEIIIFLPMINSLLNINIFEWFKLNFLFIIILLMGLYIEWNDGALNWLK